MLIIPGRDTGRPSPKHASVLFSMYTKLGEVVSAVHGNDTFRAALAQSPMMVDGDGTVANLMGPQAPGAAQRAFPGWYHAPGSTSAYQAAAAAGGWRRGAGNNRCGGPALAQAKKQKQNQKKRKNVVRLLLRSAHGHQSAG